MNLKLILMLLVLGLSVSAQNVNHKVMTLQECINYGLKNNENIKTGKLEIDYQKQLKKSSTEIPKANIMYAQGQFNSLYKKDNNFTLSQAIPFPTVFLAQYSLAKSYIKSSQLKLAATESDLIYQIKSAYFSLLYHYSIQDLLHKEDSIYQSFANSGKIKYESGGGSLLEKTASETKVLEIKNQILENEEDINSYHIQLQTLLNCDEEVDAVPEDLTQNPLTILIDSNGFSQHPYLRFLNEQVNASQKLKVLERNNNLPDLQFGYMNLSIFGLADYGAGAYTLTTANRLQGFSFGVNIPLWIYPNSAKVKAADIKTQIAQSDYNYNKTLFDGQLKDAYNLFLKYQTSIRFYKSSALTNSKVIITQALKSYNQKEITYVDYLSVVTNALNIESNYLNVIYQNDLAVLKIQYLLAK